MSLSLLLGVSFSLNLLTLLRLLRLLFFCDSNCHGVMGNSQQNTGYGCSLPAMVRSWKSVWRASAKALFGVATLAAGGSEGSGQHMAGMRWSQTGNFGSWPNPAMPHSFGAQVCE